MAVPRHPAPYDPEAITRLRFPLRVGDRIPGLENVQNYLRRFNFAYESLQVGVLDRGTLDSLRRFRRHFNLEDSDEFEASTAMAMARTRCGMADYPVAFRTRGKWNRTELTYAMLTGDGPTTIDVTQFETAVRAAFETWESAGAGLKLQRVDASEDPDIQVEWRPSADSDFSMQGDIIAHADIPPPESIIAPPGEPLPVHLDREHSWAVGAVSGHFDVQSIVLHEIGHCLGLLHSSNAQAVMFSGATTGNTTRVLHPDDRAALLSLYRVSEATNPVALRTENGHYVGIGGGGHGPLTASLARIADAGRFKPVDLGDGYVAFLADNGRYVSAEGDGTLVSNREVVESWERFLRIPVEGGAKFALRTAHGRYVRAEGGGGKRLIADRIVIEGSTLFLWIEL